MHTPATPTKRTTIVQAGTSPPPSSNVKALTALGVGTSASVPTKWRSGRMKLFARSAMLLGLALIRSCCPEVLSVPFS